MIFFLSLSPSKKSWALISCSCVSNRKYHFSSIYCCCTSWNVNLGLIQANSAVYQNYCTDKTDIVVFACSAVFIRYLLSDLEDRFYCVLSFLIVHFT